MSTSFLPRLLVAITHKNPSFGNGTAAGDLMPPEKPAHHAGGDVAVTRFEGLPALLAHLGLQEHQKRLRTLCLSANGVTGEIHIAQNRTRKLVLDPSWSHLPAQLVSALGDDKRLGAACKFICQCDPCDTVEALAILLKAISGLDPEAGGINADHTALLAKSLKDTVAWLCNSLPDPAEGICTLVNAWPDRVVPTVVAYLVEDLPFIHPKTGQVLAEVAKLVFDLSSGDKTGIAGCTVATLAEALVQVAPSALAGLGPQHCLSAMAITVAKAATGLQPGADLAALSQAASELTAIDPGLARQLDAMLSLARGARVFGVVDRMQAWSPVVHEIEQDEQLKLVFKPLTQALQAFDAQLASDLDLAVREAQLPLQQPLPAHVLDTFENLKKDRYAAGADKWEKAVWDRLSRLVHDGRCVALDLTDLAEGPHIVPILQFLVDLANGVRGRILKYLHLPAQMIVALSWRFQALEQLDLQMPPMQCCLHVPKHCKVNVIWQSEPEAELHILIEDDPLLSFSILTVKDTPRTLPFLHEFPDALLADGKLLPHLKKCIVEGIQRTFEHGNLQYLKLIERMLLAAHQQGFSKQAAIQMATGQKGKIGYFLLVEVMINAGIVSLQDAVTMVMIWNENNQPFWFLDILRRDLPTQPDFLTYVNLASVLSKNKLIDDSALQYVEGLHRAFREANDALHGTG